MQIYFSIYLSRKHLKELLCIFQGNDNGRTNTVLRRVIIKIKTEGDFAVAEAN